MEIFQKSVINKYLQSLDQSQVETAYQKFLKFYGNKTRIQNIMLLKEENYQEGFLRELFVQVLGYTINPDENYNLTTEFKNRTDAKKADAAILKAGKAIAVIELKSTQTKNLESIKQQAFNYKNNQPDCNYVITSNFQLLRFYIDNATEFEEFDLFRLTETEFNKLYLILSQDSIYSDLPTRLKQETQFHEQQITQQFYQDYSAFKHSIFHNLVTNNPQYDKLLLFQKSQKLLDRLLFVFFAEDRGLVPPNAISRIIDQWSQLKELEAYQPLYDRFKKLFTHLDKGHNYQTYELPAYDGGLFEPDAILDNVIIDDSILEQDSLKLSSYDFATEIDVNILGHIFEHSLNEIEEITAELQGTPVDRKKTKRKKEGIFYTPKYITQYIVENTIGALCRQKKQQLSIVDIAIDATHRKANGKLTKSGKELFNKLNHYKDWLLSLKILDPACGSGAFLNQALDFLINEHQANDALINQLTDQPLGLFDTDKTILEHNLYGVDINEESVEIAKLSLWLRTAKKGRKLSMLNDNIKCGNSLIDDPAVAGDKAFDWHQEFPDIMANGGFDVVIGNPPYVNFKLYPQSDRSYYKNKYSDIFDGKADLLYYFYRQGINLLKQNGILGFITSRYWLEAEYAHKLRNFITNNTSIVEIVDFKNVTIFENVGTKSNIIILKKSLASTEYNFKYKDFSGKKIIDVTNEKNINLTNILYSNIVHQKKWQFYDIKKLKIIEKLKKQSLLLNVIADCKSGIQTGCDKAFITSQRDDFKTLPDQYIKTWIKVGDIFRYSLFPSEKRYLVYTNEIDDINKYPDLCKRLLRYQDKLLNRREVKNGRIRWFDLQWDRDKRIFQNDKLLCRFKAPCNTFTLDKDRFYSSTDTTIVLLKEHFKNEFKIEYLLALLNSKLLDFYFKSYGKLMDYRYEYYSGPVSKLLIKKVAIEYQYPFITKADSMIKLNNQLNDNLAKFINRLNAVLKVNQITNRLIQFYLYDFKTFLSELKKQKITLSLKQQDEWQDYFNDYKQQLTDLKRQIDQTDREIDQMVYQLYGLTPEEIAIVEQAV